MAQTEQDRQQVVRDYHERTKHRPERYAAALGYLDWATQPDPFRLFEGTERIALPHPPLRELPTYDGLYARCPPPAGLDADFVGRLYCHSLALSAWKQGPRTRPWSLRIHPSSGALYPTEGYLIGGVVAGLTDRPGVFHYDPLHHRLERRCELSPAQWQGFVAGLPEPCLLLGLTTIHWRESWKYGERAFRYCQLDVGHVIGAIAYAVRLLGWKLRLLETPPHAALSRLLGTDRQSGIEAEQAECLLLLYPSDDVRADEALAEPTAEAWQARVPALLCSGEPNRLSPTHHDWPVIAEVARATRSVGGRSQAEAPAFEVSPELPGETPAERGHAAERIIRQRRSAQAMDGESVLDRAVFYRMLQRMLPGCFPFVGLPWAPRVSLVFFVHRVDRLAPGLYLLARKASHEAALRRTLRADFEWQVPEACPPGLRLHRLLRGDLRQTAQALSCQQDIASDGAFALAMLADFEGALAAQGAAGYPRLYWECGLIGQLLYLEAEAAGLRGTGIGCFYDDAVHELLGIVDRSWQSLYHFTVGVPLEDVRIRTILPYEPAGTI